MGVANDRVLALLQQQLIPKDHVYVHVGSSRHIVAANAVCDGAQGGLERSAAPTHCTGIQQRQAIQSLAVRVRWCCAALVASKCDERGLERVCKA